jgi:hypothetical protein
MSDPTYPINADAAKRPFRLWDAKKKAQVRWRYYADWRRAVNAAFIELKWAVVGTVIEVIDIRTGRLLGQYKRTHNSVTFHNEAKNARQAED